MRATQNSFVGQMCPAGHGSGSPVLEHLVLNNNQTAVISKASRAQVDTEGYSDDHQLPIVAQVTFTQNLEIGG